MGREEEKEEEEDSKKAVKYLKTLNGRFVKEGYHFPFFAFPEPWIDASGNRVPGFEIFFKDKVTWELDQRRKKKRLLNQNQRLRKNTSFNLCLPRTVRQGNKGWCP